ncbi:MAG: glycosyltransferase, partial [Candidatus Bathyarchaeia archaeon]
MNVYILETTKHLSRYGMYVDIFTRLQDPALPMTVSIDERARIIHIPAGPKMRCDKYILSNYIDEFVMGIVEFQRRKGVFYDLIHSHYWLSGWAAMALKEAWKVPFVHMNHTLGSINNMVVLQEEERERPIRIEMERSIAVKADRIVAASPMEKAQLVCFYGAHPSKISVIPCGVDLALFRKMEKDKARKAIGLDNRMWVLYVGRIHPVKGIDCLLEAMRILIERFGFSRREVRLLLIGGNPVNN